MRRAYIRTLMVAGIAVAGLAGRANADTANFTIVSGPGVHGSFTLTYGPSTDTKYSNAYEITGINGWFTDTNNGLNIVNAPVTSLVPISPTAPLDPMNTDAPYDFSHFAVASGLPAVNDGFLTYDNLYWPGGSSQTANDYPFWGGVFDIYGLMFNLPNGDAVDVWSNGDFMGMNAMGMPTGPGVPISGYGVAVANHDVSLDYVVGTPELSTWAMMALGFAGIAFAGYRRNMRSAAA